MIVQIDKEKEVVVHSLKITFADINGDLHALKIRVSNDLNYLHVNADSTLTIWPVATNCVDLKTVRWR